MDGKEGMNAQYVLYFLANLTCGISKVMWWNLLATLIFLNTDHVGLDANQYIYTA